MKLNFLHPEQISLKKISLPGTDTIDICIFPSRNYTLLPDSIDTLSAQEQKKAASIRMEKDRLHFLASRILLRKILSSYLNCPEKDLLFANKSHGKPYLLNWGRGNFKNTPSQIEFNLSHSGDYVALAFSTSSPIGIDIEKVRPNIRTETLARRFFHPDEYNIFSDLSKIQQLDFLFRRWTIREAILKGVGAGLTLDPRSFCVTLESNTSGKDIYCITKSQEDYSSWRIESVLAPEDYFCSIAYEQI